MGSNFNGHNPLEGPLDHRLSCMYAKQVVISAVVKYCWDIRSDL